MNDSNFTHGVIPARTEQGHDMYLFRVSLKAVIIDDKGQILVVKERGRDWWDIPGGGLDHGESIKEALARELKEEVSLRGDFEYEVLLVEDARRLGTHGVYQMRITFLVWPEMLEFEPGEDGDEVMFANPEMFKDSASWTDRKIFEYYELARTRPCQ